MIDITIGEYECYIIEFNWGSHFPGFKAGCVVDYIARHINGNLISCGQTIKECLSESIEILMPKEEPETKYKVLQDVMEQYVKSLKKPKPKPKKIKAKKTLKKTPPKKTNKKEKTMNTKQMNRFSGMLDDVDDFFVDQIPETRPEALTSNILEEIGFIVKHYKDINEDDQLNTVYKQYPFKRMKLDFALPHAQIAIEVDGDYWHANAEQTISSQQVKTKLRDKRKAASLKKEGWQLIKIWEHDVKQNHAKIKQHLQWSMINLMDL